MKELDGLHLVWFGCVAKYYKNNVKNNNDINITNNNNNNKLSERTGWVAFGLVWVAKYYNNNVENNNDNDNNGKIFQQQR